MEPSQDEEECRSSESGWTMYLGSPMEEDSGSTDGGDENDDVEEKEEQSDCDNVGSVHGGEEEEDRDVGNEDDDDDDNDNDNDDDGNGRNGRDSDDSMASDASSRPRHPGFWARSDENTKQGKVGGVGAVQGRGKVRKNLKMGKK